MTSSPENNPLDMESYQALDLLRLAPTRELWTIVLRRLLYGDFRADVERLGCEGFVRANLSEAEPAWHAELERDVALEELVRLWQPQEQRPALYLERVLQLIGSFTPPSGFAKILGQLDLHGSFNIAGETPELKKQILELALEALANYHLAPPSDAQNDTTFGLYTGYLYNKLDDPEIAVHACRRLVELGILKPSANEIERTLEAYPQPTVEEFLQIFLVSRHILAKSVLSHLYGFCLKVDETPVFNSALRHFGFRIQHWNAPVNAPVLMAPTGDNYVLSQDVIQRHMNKYMSVRFRDARFSGDARLEQLAKVV